MDQRMDQGTDLKMDQKMDHKMDQRTDQGMDERGDQGIDALSFTSRRSPGLSSLDTQFVLGRFRLQH